MRFEYVGFELQPDRDRLVCRYRLDGLEGDVQARDFTETVDFPGGGDWSRPAVTEAARLVFLLAGVSYYKAAAPPVIDLGSTALTARERAFLRLYYLEGLGEFAHRAGLDLSGLQIEAVQRTPGGPVGYRPERGPLIPFGGGVDSIVSVELIRHRAPEDLALFVVNRPGDRFDAIEQPARVAGLPVTRAERTLDEQVLRSRELGFLNGHVPVTGIISAIAVLAAVLEGRAAVVLSNEWSASSATLQLAGRSINHQWSKSEQFEAALRGLIAENIGDLEYFSLLRPFSEVWIAERFAELPQYFGQFRSCNRAFQIDRSKRWDHWCGVCDKCAFIDLVLAPFIPAEQLRQVFGQVTEPLENPELLESFRRLLALTPDAKPWECVGDVAESRVAARLALARPDRRENKLLAELVAEAEPFADPPPAQLLRPLGRHFVPERYAPDALLV